MGTFSPVHWIIAAVVILLVFGPKTLARVGRTAGRGVRTFTNVKKSITEAPKRIIEDAPQAERPRQEQS